MAYQYDIFVSYRRNPETLGWIKDHFVPLLSLAVEFELQRSPTIFVDDQIESGASWPATLGAVLGSSRVLVALWTGNYFTSVWCAEEFSQMLSREGEAKLRTPARPNGLIIPAFIHDGSAFPADLRHIQPMALQPYFNPRMARDSQRAEDLAAALLAQGPVVAASINKAPPWRKKWPEEAGRAFFRRFHRHAESQTRVPRFTRT